MVIKQINKLCLHEKTSGPHPFYLRYILILSSHLCPGLLNGLSPQSTRILIIWSLCLGTILLMCEEWT
jgi:hypothetical protein